MAPEQSHIWREWLKPNSVENRLYQQEIMETVRQKNTLVVLPTALGKTLIALFLAIERTDCGKVFLLAPTRPLVQQHHQTFRDKTLFDDEELVLVTGRSPPEKRILLYKTARITFATPQCVWNDLRNKRISLEDVSLIIFDEAHRARGNYAYVGIADYYFRQCPKHLVLGLTASPGGYEEKVAEVCRNLGIEAIEHRTDEDEDVKPYIQPIDVEWKRVKLPEVYLQVRDKLREMMIERVKALQSNGVLSGKKPNFISRRDLVELNQELQRRIRSGEKGYLYQLKVEATATLSIMHMIVLIETQGSEVLEAFIEKSLKKMALEGSRGHKSIMKDHLFLQARQLLKQCRKIENPKTTQLTKILTGQIEVKPDSRLIVFTQYRDTVNSILRELKNRSGIEVARFVGQGERKGDVGMTQEQQAEALDELRDGQITVLVATSIAEEGLDIPEVDHVVFYEPVPSEIRYIQRRGRTGRRVAGKVTIMIAENTLDEAFYWSSIRRAKKMKKIIENLNKKLPQLLKDKRKPLLTQRTLTISKPRERVLSPTIARVPEVKPASERIRKLELWAPQAFQTKGSSPALNWLLRNLPEDVTSVKELVEKAAEETRIEKLTIETAIWRLIQQGQLYQPEPGKIRKL